MFEILTLHRLDEIDARVAVEKPIEITQSSFRLSTQNIDHIINASGGIPISCSAFARRYLIRLEVRFFRSLLSLSGKS